MTLKSYCIGAFVKVKDIAWTSTGYQAGRERETLIVAHGEASQKEE